MAFGAHVQSTGVNSGSGTSANLAFGSNNTASNTLFVMVRFGGTSQTPGVSDSRGNSYTVVENYEVDGDTHILWYAAGCTAGANTVTITNATSVTRRWIIAEYEGVCVVDQHTHNNGTSFTPDSGNVTTTVAAEVLIGCAKWGSNAGAITAGTSYTKRASIEEGGGDTRITLEERVVAATGAYSAGFTAANNPTWGCIIGTFSQQSAGTQQPSEWLPLYRTSPRIFNRTVAF